MLTIASRDFQRIVDGALPMLVLCLLALLLVVAAAVWYLRTHGGAAPEQRAQAAAAAASHGFLVLCLLAMYMSLRLGPDLSRALPAAGIVPRFPFSMLLWLGSSVHVVMLDGSVLFALFAAGVGLVIASGSEFIASYQRRLAAIAAGLSALLGLLLLGSIGLMLNWQIHMHRLIPH